MTGDVRHEGSSVAVHASLNVLLAALRALRSGPAASELGFRGSLLEEVETNVEEVLAKVFREIAMGGFLRHDLSAALTAYLDSCEKFRLSE